MYRSIGILVAVLLWIGAGVSNVTAEQALGWQGPGTCEVGHIKGCLIQAQTRTFKYEVPLAQRRRVQPNYYRQRQIYCNNCVQQCNNYWYQYWQYNYNGGPLYNQCRYNCNVGACRY